MYYPTRGPEARLYCACVAAFFLPIAMFIYAWCSFSHVHWIGLVVGITVRTSGHLFFRNIYTYSFSVIRGCYVCCVPCSFLISRRLVTYFFEFPRKTSYSHLNFLKLWSLCIIRSCRSKSCSYVSTILNIPLTQA